MALRRARFISGKAYRKDLIIASTDILGADLAGRSKQSVTTVREIKHFEY